MLLNQIYKIINFFKLIKWDILNNDDYVPNLQRKEIEFLLFIYIFIAITLIINIFIFLKFEIYTTPDAFTKYFYAYASSYVHLPVLDSYISVFSYLLRLFITSFIFSIFTCNYFCERIDYSFNDLREQTDLREKYKVPFVFFKKLIPIFFILNIFLLNFDASNVEDETQFLEEYAEYYSLNEKDKMLIDNFVNAYKFKSLCDKVEFSNKLSELCYQNNDDSYGRQYSKVKE